MKMTITLSSTTCIVILIVSILYHTPADCFQNTGTTTRHSSAYSIYKVRFNFPQHHHHHSHYHFPHSHQDQPQGVPLIQRGMTRGLRLRSSFQPQEDAEINSGNGSFQKSDLEAPAEFFSEALALGVNSTTAMSTTTAAANIVSTTASKSPPSFWDNENIPPVSILLLNIVAIVWGSQHAVIKMVVDDSGNAGAFTFLRFSLAALLASPYTPGLSQYLYFGGSGATNSTIAKRPIIEPIEDIQTVWRYGSELGLWMFLGFAFQAVGLLSTTAQRSGFLLYLNVKFVPFFACIFYGRDISIPTWVSALVAFTGTAMLAFDTTGSVDFNIGDLWSIAAAASSAMFILRLETASQQVPDSAQLNAACLWVVTLMAGIWTVATYSASSSYDGAAAASFAGTFVDLIHQLSYIARGHPLQLLYLGGVTTALANYIQTKAQKDVSAERASVIYSLDPVYGALFSWLLLGEQLGGVLAFCGAGLITVAAATNAYLDFGGTSNNKKNDESATNTVVESTRTHKKDEEQTYR